jgi:tRNA nucleotidyltransferase (CCA-adding enzyme)
MDLDCLGSLILIKKLFPDYQLVRSRLIHPAAQQLYDFYYDHFQFMDPKELADQTIENIIIVDTCTAGRVSEYFGHIKNSNPAIRVYDHHRIEQCDILGAEVNGGKFGANTSFLGKLAMKEGLRLSSEEATIALTGIYSDTGRLIYENVCRDDYEVAAWLLDMGASLKLVKSFLNTIKEDDQLAVLNQLLLKLDNRIIQGHTVLMSYLELDENVAGLSAVVEKIMDVGNSDAYFAVFSIVKKKTVLIIARSQKEQIDLHTLLVPFGGGGHQFAASAKIDNREGPDFFDEFTIHLEQSLTPAIRVRDIMKDDRQVVSETMSLLDVSLFLENNDRTGVPVVDDKGIVTGFISLRDIMKGRKQGKMQAPVRAYMIKPAISCDGSKTMREIERIFYKYHISHLPIVEEGRLLGMVTRWDYLEYRKNQGG